MRILPLAACLALSAPVLVSPAIAETRVNITKGVASVTVETDNGPVEISRPTDTATVITGDFAQIARPCPNFCIQPITPVEGVRTIGELEMLEALQDPTVKVIDSRVRPNFESGTIPGAINMPYTEMADRLEELGCEVDFEGYECGGDEVPTIAMFCNGPWCGQSPAAIQRIVKAGYPVEKIMYYRWGMQGWHMLGLTTVPGE
ncbi:MAG: sulfurtransferase [Rhodobacterales bacterium]|nr:MAG: sulfurtransferase [Rhodobacterales bacterium]